MSDLSHKNRSVSTHIS